MAIRLSDRCAAYRHARIFIAAAIAATLAFPSCAYAAVRPSDFIGTATVEERGLNFVNTPSIDAEYAYVIDDEGTVYFERDCDEQTNIASITKVMTAIVALENAELDMVVTVDAKAASVGESTSQLRLGDRLTLRDALIGLMVPSGNDAAIAIAQSVGAEILADSSSSSNTLYAPDGSVITKGSASAAENAFVAMMNLKAEELGCTNTLFANSHGLDIGAFADDMHSSAKDVATFCAYAMRNEVFREIACMERATIKVDRGGQNVDVLLVSTDELLGSFEGACGIKTGFTNEAGACFAGACNRGDGYLFAIVLKSPTESQRFTDAKTLFEWVYSSEKEYEFAHTDVYASMLGKPGYEAPVIALAPLYAWNDKSVPVTLEDANAKAEVSSIFGNISQDIVLDGIGGGVTEGDVVGHIDLYQNNEIIATCGLIACESVDAPNVFESIGVTFERVFGGSGPADVVVYNQTPLILQKG